ncbi:hypothetical protein Ahy_B04g071159 [Arachis hypogaea]|uniref:Protein FAR1-RELATED SEQUENCE n=1 Tax=Arachis hypogaea TaxID=3818 RepID=A0A444ZK64_ARAHY|nr:hypothetical protein Ahy_B04g071159 [Arachis hypogaea]
MDDSTLDFYACFNMPLCDVDEHFVFKVGMTFNTLEDTVKFCKDYSKAAGYQCLDHSKVVLHHLHPYYANQAENLKQHRELGMSVHRTIENNEEASIRLSKTYQSFMVAAGSHRVLNFIKKREKLHHEGSIIWFFFVGVNHHSQSTLLGCALMKNEDI